MSDAQGGRVLPPLGKYNLKSRKNLLIPLIDPQYRNDQDKIKGVGPSNWHPEGPSNPYDSLGRQREKVYHDNLKLCEYKSRVTDLIIYFCVCLFSTFKFGLRYKHGNDDSIVKYLLWQFIFPGQAGPSSSVPTHDIFGINIAMMILCEMLTLIIYLSRESIPQG